MLCLRRHIPGAAITPACLMAPLKSFLVPDLPGKFFRTACIRELIVPQALGHRTSLLIHICTFPVLPMPRAATRIKHSGSIHVDRNPNSCQLMNCLHPFQWNAGAARKLCIFDATAELSHFPKCAVYCLNPAGCPGLICM